MFTDHQFVNTATIQTILMLARLTGITAQAGLPMEYLSVLALGTTRGDDRITDADTTMIAIGTMGAATTDVDTSVMGAITDADMSIVVLKVTDGAVVDSMVDDAN